MFARRQREAAHIDISSLVDVVFLLLIFFVVTTRFADESVVEITLPDAEGEMQEAGEAIPQISVDSSNTIYLDDQAVELDALQGRLKQLFADASEGKRDIRIKGDREANWSTMIAIFNICSKVGATQVIAPTDPHTEKP